MAERIRLVEVGPRDGLQNERTPVSVATRIEFIERLIAAGLTTIEAGSFVSEKRVPQMAGSAEVLRAVLPRSDCEFHVLVPNEQGLAAAQAAGAKVVAVFASASETFSRRNINCSIAESIERFRPVLARAKAAGIRVRGYVSCVLGCPYEGEVSVAAVVRVARMLWDEGCYEISLGDTIGVGTPGKARAMLRAVAQAVPLEHLALHCHDTYGQALANILAGLEEGVRAIDCSAGGLGGCPYAPGATGNVATEDVVYMCEGMGLATGVDLDRLVEATNWITLQLRRAPASRVAAALMAKRAVTLS
ncbi:MAG: hydroxymethylglutaryl-CoA lyase [Xanthobacteraceae bacterium]|nr:MAG: hydroxymethylglutaryl-CoA lyase [Xanthobacteraceae bacterium]